MPRTYFCIGSYYQHRDYLDLIDSLRDMPAFEDYSVVVNEQMGHMKRPAGFSATYNRLVDYAVSDPACEYVWLLNDDALPMKGTLHAVQSAMEKDPTVGVGFPVEAWPQDGRYVTMMPVTGQVLPIEEAIASGPEVMEQVFAGFACACIRKSAWERVGPMDLSLGKGYSEDLDWGIRAWHAGYRVVNYRRVWFMHERGKTFNRLTEEKLFGKDEPYKAADLAKEKWPFLWSGESFEDTMYRLKTWYNEAREGDPHGH